MQGKPCRRGLLRGFLLQAALPASNAPSEDTLTPEVLACGCARALHGSADEQTVTARWIDLVGGIRSPSPPPLFKVHTHSPPPLLSALLRLPPAYVPSFLSPSLPPSDSPTSYPCFLLLMHTARLHPDLPFHSRCAHTSITTPQGTRNLELKTSNFYLEKNHAFL